MCIDESLCLPHRLETPHSSLPYPGRLVRLFGPVVLILLSAVDHFRNQLTMSNTVTTELVRHDLPGLTAMISQ